MLRLLQNTLLYKQIVEIIQANRSLVLAKHRSSLRMKRAAIRSRIYSEILREQAEQMRRMKQIVRVSTNVKMLREVLDMRNAKIKGFNDVLKEIHQEEQRIHVNTQIPNQEIARRQSGNPVPRKVLSKLRDIVKE